MLIRLDPKIGHIDKHAFLMFLKKSTEPFLRFSQKRSNSKITTKLLREWFRKTIRSRDRKHQFQQNFLGVK